MTRAAGSIATMTSDRPIIVIGAGIAGIALSLGLVRAGRHIVLCEQAPAFAPVGAGITLSPSACTGLAWLGLGDILDNTAEPGEPPVLLDWSTGVAGVTMPSTAHLGQTRRLARADLHAILIEALQGSSRAQILMNAQLVALKETADEGITAQMSDGRLVAGSQLFGADGARSTVRRELFGDGRADFTGFVAWRFAVPIETAAPHLGRQGAMITAGPAASLTCYTVKQGTVLNCVAITRAHDWAPEGWSEPGDPDELARQFQDAHSQAQAVIALAKSNNLYRWGLFDGPILTSWSRGPVALLGDAAHPLSPFLAFGAGLAIEDAVVLARAVATLPPDRAIAAFEKERMPRASRLHTASRAQAAAFAGAKDGDLPKEAPMLDPAIFAYDPVAAPLD
jgi:salicylate hydroxylase